jgi:hypothetical protein
LVIVIMIRVNKHSRDSDLSLRILAREKRKLPTSDTHSQYTKM